MLSRVDRWLLAHGHTLDRVAWVLSIAAIAYVAGSVALR